MPGRASPPCSYLRASVTVAPFGHHRYSCTHILGRSGPRRAPHGSPGGTPFGGRAGNAHSLCCALRCCFYILSCTTPGVVDQSELPQLFRADVQRFLLLGKAFPPIVPMKKGHEVSIEPPFTSREGRLQAGRL